MYMYSGCDYLCLLFGSAIPTLSFSFIGFYTGIPLKLSLTYLGPWALVYRTLALQLQQSAEAGYARLGKINNLHVHCIICSVTLTAIA